VNNTLVKGLRLLAELARSRQPLGATELAQRLALGKSDTHRLAQTLVEQGYARQDAATGAYRASVRVWELGAAVLANLDLKQAAAGPMQVLLAKTRETVHLSMLDGDEVVYLDKLDSPEPVRAYTQIGGRAPAHCVATGKALLAFQPTALLDALAGRLAAHSPNSIVARAAFLDEMARIRAAGFATNRGEWRVSVWGVAAPIHGPDGSVVAAVGVSGPAERVRGARLKTLGTEVVTAAHAIETALN
jgi:IclR family KDG regulon transcriptional repressor